MVVYHSLTILKRICKHLEWWGFGDLNPNGTPENWEKHVVSEHGGMNIELGVMGHVAFMAHQLFVWDTNQLWRV